MVKKLERNNVASMCVHYPASYYPVFFFCCSVATDDTHCAFSLKLPPETEPSQAQRLTDRVALSRLSGFDKLCSEYDVPINSHDEGERSELSVLINFRNFLADRSNGVSQGHGRPKVSSTPAAKAKATPAPKARLTVTPSGTPASSQASGGKARSRGGSSSKRKSRAIGSEDEDEDGWVAAPSQVGSMASSSSDGKRSRK